MTQMSDATAPKTEIINHPDVRRLLMEQKAHAEGTTLREAAVALSVLSGEEFNRIVLGFVRGVAG